MGHPIPSLNAESLRPINGIYLDQLVLDDEACRGIHDANLESIALGSSLYIRNVDALRLRVRGPRELIFNTFFGGAYGCTPYGKILASLTEDSKVRCLRVQSNFLRFFFSRDVVPLQWVSTLQEFHLTDCIFRLHEWKLLWELIGSNVLTFGTVRTEMVRAVPGRIISPDEKLQAMRIVADVMRNNRSITKLKLDSALCNEDAWKTCIVPCVRRNLLFSYLHELDTELDLEVRSALVGHLLRTYRDDNAELFEILVRFTDNIMANTRRKAEE
jgi:hypothetical protein